MDQNNDAGKKRLTLKLDTSKVNIDSGQGSKFKKQGFSSGSKSVTVEVKKNRSFIKKGDAQDVPSDLNLTKDEFNRRIEIAKVAANNKAEQNRKIEEEQENALLDYNSQKDLTSPSDDTSVDAAQEEVINEISVDTNVIEEYNNEKPSDLFHAKDKKASHTKFEEDEVEDVKVIKKEVKPKEDVKSTVSKVLKDDIKKLSKVDFNSLLNSDDADEQSISFGRKRSYSAIRRAKEKAANRKFGKDLKRETEKIVREVVIGELITVADLANRMAEKSSDVIKELMKLGMMVTINQSIDADTAELVVMALGHKIKRVNESDVENILIEKDLDNAVLDIRAPVVTIMGHVDHGKTSLLDALRTADVASGEAGGITQHIGAYQVTVPNGQHITFLDTPGHEAFTAMRSRGAKVTDIVVLVVAADDGIMAQTIEAINHAKAANVPVIVAINKIDKPGADIERVKQELLSHNIVLEEFGGDTVAVPVSAKQKLNLDKLIDAILLQAEIMELKANYETVASGTVIESKIDKGRGVLATLLVQRGTLRQGDLIVAGCAYGRVRLMLNDHGKSIKEAIPSTPVEVVGLDLSPEAGDKFNFVSSDKQAREVTAYRDRKLKEAKNSMINRTNILQDMFARAASDGKVKELPIIIKADVNGSVEAIVGSVMKFSNSEVKLRILHSAVGGITESDVTLAEASNAIILGFNVRASATAKTMADRAGVDIRYYSIIYNLIDDIKLAINGMLSPILREEYIGNAEIRQVFDVSKYGRIAGCYVTKGMIKRGAGVRLLRDNIVIHEGKLKTLRRFKDDVKEVKDNFECGIAFENYDDIKVGDMLEAFEIVQEANKNYEK